MRVLQVNQRSGAEIDAQRKTMPEQHRADARYAEYQREGDEIPLLAQEIDIRITKKFHALEPFRHASSVARRALNVFSGRRTTCDLRRLSKYSALRPPACG